MMTNRLGFFTTAGLLALLVVFGTPRFVDAQGQGGQPSLTAKLVDPETKAAKKEATVEVTTTGVAMTDPASVGEKPAPGQGHLHYQVDQGPVIATPTTKLSFHGLTPGAHSIIVTLAGNDHKPLLPPQTLNITIPK
jgi:hypothetical protein